MKTTTIFNINHKPAREKVNGETNMNNEELQKNQASQNDGSSAEAERNKKAAEPLASYRRYENMPYQEALQYLSEGSLVKLPEWNGFWFAVRDKIWVFTKDGQILDTPDHETFGQRNDWTAVIPKEVSAAFIKTIRVRVDTIMNHIKSDVTASRESSLAYTAAQLGFMYLGLHLGVLGAANPYPKSTDPSSPVIEKHADKAVEDYLLAAGIAELPDETAKVKKLRLELQNHIDFVLSVCRDSGYFPQYWATALDELTKAKLWLGQCLNNIRVAQEGQQA